MQHPSSNTSGRAVTFRDLPYAVVAFGLFLLNLIRVIRVPVTIDEAPNRSDLSQGFDDIISLRHVSANNHILNSVLRKLSVGLLGNTPFALRCPTLLAYAVFLWIGYRLCKKLFADPYRQFCAFLVLNLNPFVFEFWTYSRGYGLAVACMTAAMLATVNFVQTGRRHEVCAALGFAAAAVWSNFALLNFYLPLCAVLMLEPVWARRRLSARFATVVPVLVISAGLAALITDPIRKLRAAGELYYGGDTDVITNTITSLAKESLHIAEPESLPVQVLVWGYNALSILIATFYLRGLLHKRSDAPFRTGTYIFLINGLIILGLVVQHALLGTKYLTDRTALFMIPLIMLNLICVLDLSGARFRRFALGSILSLALLHVINFARTVSLEKSHVWWLDNYNEAAVSRMARLSDGTGRPVRLRVCWILMPGTDYYIYTRYPDRFVPPEYRRDASGVSDTGYDFLFFPRADIDSVSPLYRIDTIYENNLYLYRKREPASGS